MIAHLYVCALSTMWLYGHCVLFESVWYEWLGPGPGPPTTTHEDHISFSMQFYIHKISRILHILFLLTYKLQITSNTG